MPKVFLEKRFYSFNQLSERWGCTVDDVRQLVECGLLKTVPRLAAAKGKTGIWLVVYDNIKQATLAAKPDDAPDYCIVCGTYPFDEEIIRGFSHGDVMSRLHDQLKEAGDFDPVVTQEDVYRYESENPMLDDPSAPEESKIDGGQRADPARESILLAMRALQDKLGRIPYETEVFNYLASGEDQLENILSGSYEYLNWTDYKGDQRQMDRRAFKARYSRIIGKQKREKAQ